MLLEKLEIKLFKKTTHISVKFFFNKFLIFNEQ